MSTVYTIIVTVIWVNQEGNSINNCHFTYSYEAKNCQFCLVSLKPTKLHHGNSKSECKPLQLEYLGKFMHIVLSHDMPETVPI